jgi:uncharacterized protein YqjF (DUF2071 family)
MTPARRLRASRIAVLVHAAALAITPLALVPGLPPVEPALRRAFLAAHPLAWAVGWVVWMLAAGAWVWFVRAWKATLPRGDRRGTAALALAGTGALLDGAADLAWLTAGPDAVALRLMGAGNVLYAAAGVLLTVASLPMPGFPGWLAAWSGLVWAATAGLAGAALAGDGRLVNLASGILFPLFLPWLAVMGPAWLGAVRPGGGLPAAVRALVPKHPLPMRTVFRQCFLVNFAVRAEVMRGLVPAPLEPDLHRGEAFLSVVIAVMDRMRPAFVPAPLGVTYRQVVYRAVVRHRGERGVYFLRSDADHRWMSLAGDWLTFFRFHSSPIAVRGEGPLVHVDLAARPGDHADIRASFEVGGASRSLPPASRFASLAEAQAFLVELYVAFGCDATTGEVRAVRIDRGEWDLRVVADRRAQYDFMDGSRLFPAGSARLDSVFYVEAIPYYWHTLTRP